MSSRLVEVEPERLLGWVARFSAAHGGAPAEVSDDGRGGMRLVVLAADGARADLEVPWPSLPQPPSLRGAGDDAVAALAAHAAAPRTALVVLVRRGGWAVGLAREGVVLEGTCGTRYVQARTAAGGWSQQRYARRRANQAEGLVSAACSGLRSVLATGLSTGLARSGAPEVLVPGGDRQLVADVLAGAPAVATSLPAGPLLDVPDPRRRVLDDVARRARCVRIVVRDPA